VADWDANLYHRLSGPQFQWGLRVLDRLAPAPGEIVLDLGCGTGRLTAEILDRVAGGRVVGMDRSDTMLSTARDEHRSRDSAIAFVRGDGAALPFAPVFDAVFSTATLHWIRDHDAAFRSIFRVLKPGGRLAAQCGGGPNLERLLEDAHRLMRTERYRQYFDVWSDPWFFADAGTTRDRLATAGFEQVHVWLEESPTEMPDAQAYQEFIATVCVRHHVDRLPADERRHFTRDLTDAAAGYAPPYTLDYWRLNIDARRPRRVAAA
jgi:trans-aconitate 2-methyltransferase